ncbi:pentatricopeptide repeat-containing protein At4g25270, chloroplastic [Momordica charantia]|uniref:Pentatricopeptide repeat-containing protein At4g25270, chloroplastic n=1 Tax=Momordica charantia TaxID=3673 RepID=A0A6J1CGA6_MOMCH|nr:pentatricopeptide repeat-containing protein At4g25270, chloroplastic [Momordica charantia]
MLISLQLSTSLPPFCSSKPKKSKKERRKLLQEKLIRISKSKHSTLSFPKSSSTPLLIHHKPFSQTKIQALEAVLDDLEASLENGVPLDAEIFSSLLETCYQLRAIGYAIRIHRLIPTTLLRRNVGVSSKLLRLYASFGYMESAHQVFDEMCKRNVSAFAWNSLISGYAELGLYEDALALYFQMEEEGVEPDHFTFPRVLKACGGIGSIQIGEAVHRHIVRSGFAGDVFVLNALVDMYSKCGDIVRARKVFDQIVCKDTVSWNSMLTGYTRHGLLLEALDIFDQLIREGYEPDSVALSTILSNISSLKFKLHIHGWVIRQGVEWNLSIANSLIVVYANSGKIDRAKWLFQQMPQKDTISWNSVISAHSNTSEALEYFEQMESHGVLPDTVTFVSLLSTCAHLGLVKEGERLHSVMKGKYGIRPTMEHYACMVNLYGRAGLIEEAYRIIIRGMELEAGPTVWGALLYACFLRNGSVDIAEIAAEKLFELEPDNELNFELLMKIYGNAGRSEDEKRVRLMMKERGLDG